jgi:hypothetical protein
MTHTCPCGAPLVTRAELLDSDDEMDRHLAYAYVGDDDGFCFEEDEVVPLGYAAEILRRRRENSTEPTTVDLDFPLF